MPRLVSAAQDIHGKAMRAGQGRVKYEGTAAANHFRLGCDRRARASMHPVPRSESWVK